MKTYLIDSTNSHLNQINNSSNLINESSNSHSINLISTNTNSNSNSNLMLSSLVNNHVIGSSVNNNQNNNNTSTSSSSNMSMLQQQQMFLYNKPIGSEREKPKLQQQISQQLILNSSNSNLNSNNQLGIISSGKYFCYFFLIRFVLKNFDYFFVCF